MNRVLIKNKVTSQTWERESVKTYDVTRRWKRKFGFDRHSFIPKSGYSQGGLWISQWHPLALAPGCLTILSHCSIHVLLGSQMPLSILGNLVKPRLEHLCRLSFATATSSLFFFFIIVVRRIIKKARDSVRWFSQYLNRRCTITYIQPS